MLNLRDLIFSQESAESSQTPSSTSRPNYDEDEYVDYPDDEEGSEVINKARKKQRRGSKYLGAAPLSRGKGSKKFCAMYDSTPEIAFSKDDLSCSETYSVANLEVWARFLLNESRIFPLHILIFIIMLIICSIC